METRNPSTTILSIVMSLLIPAIITAGALGVCDNEPDAPDCPCFNNTGAWDPSASFI